MAGLDSHHERANNYIGAAHQAAREDPTVTAALARAEAVLALADAVDRLAAAVLTAGGVPTSA